MLHVQFAMHRHFSGKLSVFFTISLSLIFSVRLQLLTKIKYLILTFKKKLRDLSEISRGGRGGGDFQLSDENKMILPR